MDEQANFKEKERETNKLASDLAMFQAGKGPVAVFQGRRLGQERAREAAVQAQKFGAKAGFKGRSWLAGAVPDLLQQAEESARAAEAGPTRGQVDRGQLDNSGFHLAR